jgi:hypothetical protein
VRVLRLFDAIRSGGGSHQTVAFLHAGRKTLSL